MEAKGIKLGVSLVVPSVQELAKEHLIKVPSRYVRPDHEPQVIPSPLPQVPIIDMERLTSKDFVGYELEKLHMACKDWGFFQVINHGISCSLLERVKEETRQLFELPTEEKKKLWQTPEDLEGFGQAFVFSEEQKLDWADIFFLVTLPHHRRKPHLFPNLPLPFRDTLEEYSREVMNAAKKTLLYIAKALNMETTDLMALFEEGMQSMRMNYYPPCPQPEQVIGLAPHSDAVGVTFLLELNEVHGLEIRKDGAWIPITPLHNAFIVNIGEILEIVTNGQYKSIEHRATVNAEGERLSIATFINPNINGEIGPAPSLATAETPPNFARVATLDFFQNLFSKELKGKSNLEQYRI
ncbi:putative codeine 3-O-demethylase [Helianthus anomalus]